MSTPSHHTLPIVSSLCSRSPGSIPTLQRGQRERRKTLLSAAIGRPKQFEEISITPHSGHYAVITMH